MSTHTPAPWVLTIRPGMGKASSDATVAEINLSLERGQAYRGSIAYMQSAEHIDGIGKDELIANARLIAAAPDMLEVLQRLVRDNAGVTHEYLHIIRDKARAAIAKATEEM
jgi:hypothetical protein